MVRRAQLVLPSWTGVTLNIAVVVEEDVAVGVGEGLVLRFCVVGVGVGPG